MNKYVADTMAIVLFLEKRKLPVKIKALFSQALTGEIYIYFSTVSLMEIGYLSEKGRIDINIKDVVNLDQNNRNFIIQSLDVEIIKEAFDVITDIPELHDRLIAATASVLTAELITNDPLISASKYVEAVWQ